MRIRMRIIRPHLMAVTFKKVHVETFRTIRYLDHGSYVLVISPLGVMLLVYRPDTRGRVAPEGEGL